MKFPKTYTLKKIAAIINAKPIGQDDFEITGMNEIHVINSGEIVFVDNPKYYDKALQSKASVILINKEVECPEGKALLVSDDPFRDFNKLTEYFNRFKKANQNISESAIIGKNTIIQPQVFIGHNVKIGENCIIHPNVCIYDGVELGDNIIIHSGAVLGADAFYYKNRQTHHDKLKSGGSVIIEDDVELGANTTIDKGVTANTIIKKGTKIDNQVQIGHDTIVGERCIIAAQVGIAGCVVVEDEVTIWGQVGIASGLTIGKKSIILATSGISKDCEPGKTYFGSPAADIRKKYRELASVSRLPDVLSKLKKLI
ncbi:UDP-3-O-(3-hydroxymyristoyl)glucosamine N-acyltransferase [Flavobacteriaceae bacterium 14752]|uniref:UDP-3-O-(3-hydroxymyristoyl)glucosamine N-acyltransferase n=1 Tax=Mesohalobacter salilacus TaxID=2491711 RepID=UPI000F641ACD|nr:UDP-3-O-(3-hydroxymyristoyl)glucosamine N-acyltransferase [Flavobacteriaceae bacterium 14752]